MNIKKKIFITGASSELMKKLILFINKKNFEIFCLSRKNSERTENGISLVKGDIQNIHLFKKELKSCDIIIHAAAITHSSDKERYFDINLEATKELVDIAVEFKIKKFIFISSRAAGLKSGSYGKSKILAEEYIKQTLNNWLIFRPSEIFGGSKNEGIQKLFSDIKTKKNIICPLSTPKLFPVFIDDTTQIIYDFSFNKKIINKIITVNGKEGYTYKELVKLTTKIFQKKNRIIPIPKFIILFMQIILETFHLNIGIAPDQISRLYGKKGTENLSYNLIGVEDYLRNFGK